MANTVKAWILANPTLDNYYETCDVVYEGRYSIQKLLTNNELKYAVTEEYSFRESEEIKDRQYYTLNNTPSDMEQRYLLCTGYVYRFRSRTDTNNQYAVEVLLYIADSGAILGIVEIIPSESSVSDNIPSVPPEPYTDYTLNITGVEQSTIITFIIDNPILSKIPDVNDGSVFLLDEDYYFDDIASRDEYFRQHPIELATRSPLLVAVRDTSIKNKYNIWRYYHNTNNWENIMAALAGLPGPGGRHAVMVVPEDAVTTGEPGSDAVVRCTLVNGASDSDEEEKDSNIYKLSFTIPRGDPGAQGIPGNCPVVGGVQTQTLEYSNTAQAFIDESFDEDIDPGHLQPYMYFRFAIPRGFPGISPKVDPDTGHWMTYTDVLSASDEYEPVDTGIMARGDPGKSPRVNTTTWHWEIAVPTVVGITTEWIWVDTGIRAYGTNLLFTTLDIYPGNTRTIPVSDFYTNFGYETDDITLNSVVISKSAVTHNNYGRITGLIRDENNALTGVTVKYENTIDSRTTVNSFVPNTYYSQGELCLYEGVTYRALYSFTSGTDFQSKDWERLTGESLIVNDYIPDTVYRYHEVIQHGSDFYRCESTGFPGFNGTLLFEFNTQGPVEWWRKAEVAVFTIGNYYEAGDIVSDSGVFYRCILSHLAAAGEDPATDYINWEQLSDPVTDAWVSGQTYLPGQYAIYNSELYLCANSNTQTVFTPNNLYWYELAVPVTYDENFDYEVSNGTYVKYVYNGSVIIGLTDGDTLTPLENPDHSLVYETDVWQANTQYDEGYYILHNNVLFRCCKQNTLAAFRMDDPSIPYTIWENMRGSTGPTYTAGDAISLNNNAISVKTDSTLTVNANNELSVVNSGTTYTAGDAISLTNNAIGVKTDSTLTVNANNELSVVSSGGYSAGSGISISSNTISVSTDSSLTVNNNQLGVVIDSALSGSSSNPVQNQVIYQAIGDLETLLNRI